MTNNPERPKFLPSFFAALSERSERGTLWRMFFWPATCVGVGFFAAYYTPVSFWSDDKWDVAATVYTGVLTLNGLILALSWSAFSRIYESISAPNFCAFLRRNGLLNKYIVTVSTIHGLQVLAVLVSASGLITLVLVVPFLLVDQILYGSVVAISALAIQQASTAVGIMSDLLWQKSYFDENVDNSENKNIVPMDGRNGNAK